MRISSIKSFVKSTMKLSLLVLTVALASVLAEQKFGNLSGSKAVTSSGQMKKDDNVREKFVQWKVSESFVSNRKYVSNQLN